MTNLAATPQGTLGWGPQGAYRITTNAPSGQNTTPSAPTIVTLIPESSTELRMTWAAPVSNGGATITGYKIQKETSVGSGIWTTEIEDTGLILEYLFTSLTRNTTYSYRIAAWNSVGLGLYQTVQGSTPAELPSVPLSPSTGSPTTTSLTLSWSAPSDTGGISLTGYDIQQESSLGAGDWNTIVQLGVVTSTVISSLTRATQYSFRIAAINALGIGPYTSSFQGTTSVAVPDAPTLTSITVVSDTALTPNWTFASENGGASVTSWKLQRKTGAGGTYSDIVADSGNTNTSFADTGLTASTIYFYRVASKNSAGFSAFSNELSATTNAPTPIVPDAPTWGTATAQGASQIDLAWNIPTSDGGSPITDYIIEFKIGAGSYNVISDGTNTNTTYSHIGLAASTQHTYRLKAVNAVGQSGYSSEISATTGPPGSNPDFPAIPFTKTYNGTTGVTVNAGVITFLSFTADTTNTTESNRQNDAAVNGTIQNVKFVINTNDLDGGAEIQIRLNGVTTNNAHTIFSGGTGTFEDTDSIPFVLGNLLGIRVDTTGATSGSITINSVIIT